MNSKRRGDLWSPENEYAIHGRPQVAPTKSPCGLYIHIPFCRRKCLYCDFYSVALEDGFARHYTDAVIRNIKVYGGSFDTVYFGGGTPILLAPYLGEMLRAADIAEGAEITAEANPCEMTEAALEELLKAGVNRISVGVQSFCDNELQALGRRHDSDTAEKAILRAEAAGFTNISADLMLGVPHQNADSLSQSLERMAELPITHISAYMLKVEENTPFGRNTPVLPDEDETADMYLHTVNTLAQHGFHQYEISNFARSTSNAGAATCRRCDISIPDLYACKHNLKYWHAEEYLGIGPAAHSFLAGRRFGVPRDLDAFLSAERQQEQLTEDAPDPTEERIMLGLRLSEGIPETLWRPLEAALKRVPKNYYSINDGRLRLTAEGFLLSNEIISLLLSEL